MTLVKRVLTVVLVALLAGTALPLPTAAATTASLQVRDWQANTATGVVAYDLLIAGTQCAGCNLNVDGFYVASGQAPIEQARLESLWVGDPNTTTTYSIPLVRERTLPEITDIRLQLRTSDAVLSEQWARVHAPYPAAQFSLNVRSWNADYRTGEVDMDFTFSGSGLGGQGGPCPPSRCVITLQGGNYRHGIWQAGDIISGYTCYCDRAWSFTTSRKEKVALTHEVTHVRVEVANESAYRREFAVAAPYPSAHLSVAVHRWSMEGERSFDFELNAVGLKTSSEPCQYECSYALEGWQEASDGTRAYIQVLHQGYGRIGWVLRGRYSGTAQDSRVNLLRLVIRGGVTRERWVRLGSKNVQDDRDVGRQAQHLTSYVAAGFVADPCIELFPTGPRTNGTSLNDLQYKCESLRAAGQAWAATFSRVATTVAGGGLALVAANQLAHQRWKTATDTAPERPPHPAAPRWQPGDPAPLDDLMMEQGGNRITGRIQVTGKAFQTAVNVAEAGKRIYKQCVALRSAIADCDTLPIYAPGVDVNEAAQHDRDAIATAPSWSALSYATTTERTSDGADRYWYRNQPSCAADTTASDGKQCDEFPFFTSEEGGAGTASKSAADLRRILAADNTKQGSQVLRFGQVCGLPQEPRRSTGRRYLVIPLPDSGLASTAWCSR